MDGLVVDKWIDVESLVDRWVNRGMDDTQISDWWIDGRPTDRAWMDGLRMNDHW